MKKIIVLIFVITLIFQSCSNQSKNETYKTGFDFDNIDSNFNACEDFFHFANNKWLEKNPIPKTESRWGSFHVLYKNNKEKLKAILERASKAPINKEEEQIGAFYNSVLDSDAINKKGISPIQPYLDKIDNINNKSQILNTMAELVKTTGSFTFFSFYVSADNKNSEFNTLFLSQGGLGLPDRDYYFNKGKRGTDIFKAYENYITQLFTVAKDKNPNKVQKDVITIETKLAKVSMDRVEQRDRIATYNKMNLKELSKLSPKIDWTSFFELAGLKNVNELVVRQPKFIKALGNIIEESDLTTLKNYMKWHLVNDFASLLSKDFVDARFSFYATTLSGVKEQKPRWEKALSYINKYESSMLLGKIFVKKHFPESSKNRILKMIKNINIVFKERLNDLKWMSEKTKEKALDKLNKFTYKIGYPDKWEDLSSVEVSSNSAVANATNFHQYEYNKMVSYLYKPVEKWRWGMYPHMVNAYYNPKNNEIVFPAGILQPPFFDAEGEDAINYGGIGGVIGHEFSHGFDDQGAKFNGDGNMENWWTQEDSINFVNKSKKLVDQFESYTVNDSLKVNGKLTLGENIADLAGITLAYHAYMKSLEGKTPPPVVDEFTHQQRFFLGWAQVWASHSTKESLEYLVKTNPHSPALYRVIGPISNLKEFDQAYNCKSNKEKISIW